MRTTSPRKALMTRAASCDSGASAAVLLAREEGDVRPRPSGERGVELGAEPLALGCRDATGPAVDNQAALERREVAAGHEVALANFDVRAERLQDAAAEPVAERVVAEQAEVGRAAPGRNAHQDGVGDAAAAAKRQAVQMGRLGGLQLGLAVPRQASQPVDDEQDDLGLGRLSQLSGQGFPFHGRHPSFENSLLFARL
jgi:hypothetical protein